MISKEILASFQRRANPFKIEEGIQSVLLHVDKGIIGEGKQVVFRIISLELGCIAFNSFVV
jgi:hypothetical protein